MKKHMLIGVLFALSLLLVTAVSAAELDFDRDGLVTAGDAKTVLGSIASGKTTAAMDVNEDGRVGLADALEVMKASAETTYFDGTRAGQYNNLSYTNYGITMQYRVYLPENYDPNETYALATHLYGKEISTIPMSSVTGESYFKNIIASEYGANTILMLPKCPVNMTWWENRETLEMTYEIIEMLCKNFPIDKNRLYISGHSNGALGTFFLLDDHPNYFAAAVCSSGASQLSKYNNVSGIAGTPVRMFCGTLDDYPTTSSSKFFTRMQTLNDKLNNYGGDSVFTPLEGKGHDIFNLVGNTEGLIDWVFAQVRK